jgi:enhancer of polycomb-like protein
VVPATDSNPHAVFRARETEKYKLRRSRKNDVEAYNKMMVLRMDFRRIRQLMKLVVKREQVNLARAQVEEDIFNQKLADLLDTSGQPRVSAIDKEAIAKLTKLAPEEWTLGGSTQRVSGRGGGGR